MKNLLFIACLALLAGCAKDEQPCADYQMGSGKATTNNQGQIISVDCENANIVYSGTYIKNAGQQDWSIYDVTPHTDIDKFWLNGFYYAVLDKDDLTKFTIPEQDYTVPGIGDVHVMANSYGDFDGIKLHVHIYVGSGNQVIGDDWIGYKQ